MTKVNNNKILSNIVFGLLMLLILGLGAIAFIPRESKAYTERYGYVRPYSEDFVDTFQSPNYGGANAVTPPSSPTPSGTVLGASTTKTTKKPATTTAVKTEFKDLTANAVYGSNSFLPSGLIAWVLLAIIILIIIILVRKFFGAEDRYQSTPLKHS
ncbi:MAG: hypothetical protein V4486_00930 [Patescibacteria group bacterium]